MSPRVREGSVHPRLQSGACVRPLNFTVSRLRNSVPYLVGIFLVPLIAVLFYSFVLFDRLLRTEYEQYRPAWEADGSASGFFWRARECRLFRSDLARLRLSLSWLFRTPAWVTNSSSGSATLRRLRLGVLVWNVGILLVFIAFVASLRG